MGVALVVVAGLTRADIGDSFGEPFPPHEKYGLHVGHHTHPNTCFHAARAGYISVLSFHCFPVFIADAHITAESFSCVSVVSACYLLSTFPFCVRSASLGNVFC